MEKPSPRIVLIEDETMLLEALQEDLVEAGYIVDACTEAEAAFEKMRENKPDVILTDLVLPNMDGFEVLRVLKENLDLCNIPVVVLSNLSDEADVEKARELGAVGFLVKAEMTLGGIVEKVTEVVSRQ